MVSLTRLSTTTACGVFGGWLAPTGVSTHFSRCLARESDPEQASFSDRIAGGSGGHILHLHKGRGMCYIPEQDGFDGLLLNNTFAAYTHVFAPALPHWAANFVALCAGRRG